MRNSGNGNYRIGILDDTGKTLGGGQLVAAQIAATLSKRYEVDLISDRRETTVKAIEAAFDLDLHRIKERIVEGVSDGGFEIPGQKGFLRQLKRSRSLVRPYDLFIYCGHGTPPVCRGRPGLVYCHFPRSPAPLFALRESGRWQSRNRLDRCIRGAAYELIWRLRMREYRRVLANSRFTAQWVKKLWGIPAEVLYPPVALSVPETVKEDLVISVGRFDPSFRRNKQQAAQVEAFREFAARTGGDWKMCMAGASNTPRAHSYLAVVKRAAEGAPIEFLVNSNRESLGRVLASAKIFWHTQGLSSDDSKYPWEAEHFGIATVEAMRAGCVPVVIASGGQREIVEDGVSGFLCKNIDELVEKSITVASDDTLRSRISGQAKQRSMAFTREAFEHRIGQIVSEYASS